MHSPQQERFSKQKELFYSIIYRHFYTSKVSLKIPAGLQDLLSGDLEHPEQFLLQPRLSKRAYDGPLNIEQMS